MNFRVIACACILGLFPLCLQAQSIYKLVTGKSELIIKGTSSLHDWQCRAEQMTGTLQVGQDLRQLRDLTNLLITIGVNSIRSIRDDGSYYEKGMDKNMYRAMKAEQYPSVTLSLVRITEVNQQPNGSVVINALGNLRILGITRAVSISAIAKVQQGGILFEGKLPIKMTDYSIDPPTALFGTIKTGNEVVVHYSVFFQPSK